jgi:hypothetical protein
MATLGHLEINKNTPFVMIGSPLFGATKNKFWKLLQATGWSHILCCQETCHGQKKIDKIYTLNTQNRNCTDHHKQVNKTGRS